MKLVLATQTYAPVIGGEERHVQDLAGWLAGHGHDVSPTVPPVDRPTIPAMRSASDCSQVELPCMRLRCAASETLIESRRRLRRTS
jgi:hypothetical protein